MCTHVNRFEAALLNALRRSGMEVSTRERQLLTMHYVAMIEANRTVNLTRITEPEDAAVKHYADSLALLLWTHQLPDDFTSVLDIGSGAGFPAVPLAVMRPAWNVTAIDATGKKTSFLSKCVAEMGLTNLRIEHAHSDHWQSTAPFQLVVLRAVAKLSDALAQALPHLAAGGWIAAYKTADVGSEELEAASVTARELSLQPQDPFAYDLELRGEVLRRALHTYHYASTGRKPTAKRRR